MNTITLNNDFHSTSVNLRVDLSSGSFELSPAQVRRARRELCGVTGCACGDALGRRGRQDGRFSVEPGSSTRVTIEVTQ